MNRPPLALLLALPLLCLLAFPAVYGIDGSTHATLSFTTDFFWRGYSKSDDSPSYQLNLEYDNVGEHSGFFAGAWAATIDFTDSEFETASNYEFVLYGGWSQGLGDDYRVDIQYSRYLYDDQLFGRDSDYSEFYLFTHYRDIATFELAYAPEAYSIGPETFNYQLTGRYPVIMSTDVSAGVGYYQAVDLFEYDYWYWNIGATWRSEHLAVDLRYFGSAEVNEVVLTRNFWMEELPFEKAKAILTISVGF